LANKQYISVIRLFEYCGIPTDSDFNLQRVKKQLQAEFSIAQHGFIEVDGFTYTRHDIVEEIERPDFSERLVFHKQLWNSSVMLDLLEQNNTSILALGEAFRPFTGNEKFDAFFSPYFAGPFSYMSRTFLPAGKLNEMGSLLAFEGFLLPAEREEAFRPLRLFFEENLRLFRNINKENYSMMRPKMLHWIETDWHLFFNNLPHEFYEQRNEITTFLINIGVAIQKSNRSDCRKMSDQLISLQDTPESLRSIIVSNHAVYSGSSKSSGGWGNYFWVGWVIFMVIRLAASDGCESKKTTNYYEMPQNWEYKKKTDSLFKVMMDSSFKSAKDDDTLIKISSGY
jgi:hypothetical protein